MRTSNGRFIYAVGGNEETARMSGLPVKYVKISVFLISALLATVAGILFVARVGMCDPDTGQTLPLDSIATVTIGGGALTGGIGTVPGTIIGVLILSVLNNIMSLLQTPPTIQSGIEGIVILVAVYFNSLKKRL
jgi:ribose transport system permease protein